MKKLIKTIIPCSVALFWIVIIALAIFSKPALVFLVNLKYFWIAVLLGIGLLWLIDHYRDRSKVVYLLFFLTVICWVFVSIEQYSSINQQEVFRISKLRDNSLFSLAQSSRDNIKSGFGIYAVVNKYFSGRKMLFDLDLTNYWGIQEGKMKTWGNLQSVKSLDYQTSISSLKEYGDFMQMDRKNFQLNGNMVLHVIRNDLSTKNWICIRSYNEQDIFLGNCSSLNIKAPQE